MYYPVYIYDIHTVLRYLHLPLNASEMLFHPPKQVKSRNNTYLHLNTALIYASIVLIYTHIVLIYTVTVGATE